MIEVIVERWTQRTGGTEFRWSVWRDGARVQMGGPHPSADVCEREADEFCRLALGRPADAIERL